MPVWPQYTIAALQLIGLGISLVKHGKPKTGTENFGSSIVAVVLFSWLLYMGGFWSAL